MRRILLLTLMILLIPITSALAATDTLNAAAKFDSVKLTWTIQSVENYDTVNIYRNGSKIGSTTSSSYTDENVTSNTTYQYKITVTKDGNETAEIALSNVKTLVNPIINHFKFNESSGNVTDSVGTAIGTVTGATRVAGVSGNALNFDGNDYVSFNSKVLPLTQFSIRFKVKTNQISTSNYYPVLLDTRGITQIGGFYNGILIMNYMGGLNISINKNNIDIGSIYFSGIANGSWRDVLITLKNRELNLYVDNINTPVKTTTLTSDLTVHNRNLSVGKFYDNNTHFFTGQLDELEIYNDVITKQTSFTNSIVHTASEVTNLTASEKYNQVKLTFTSPTDPYLKEMKIYRDGVYLGSTTSGEYIDNSVKDGKNYVYKVTTYTTDNAESAGVTVNATTPAAKASGEVTGVAADAKYDQVTLSWTNPTDSYFKSVKIYRNGIYLATTTSNTYTDKTVIDKTSYEYKISTVSTEDAESTGVKINTTTPISPVPKMEDVSYSVSQTKDYTYSWTSPTEGTVKIMVGGKLYATVDASDLQVTIPSTDMKYKPLGDPDVSLIPVNADGIEGKPVEPVGESSTIAGLNLPFSATDALSSGVKLLLIVGPFVLLTLAFLVVPSLRNSVITAFNGGDGKEAKGRRSGEEGMQRDPVIKEERMKIEREERDRTARERSVGRRVT